MPDEYKHNHYVPEWYQKRFLPEGQYHQHFLDLKPEALIRDGHKFIRKDKMDWGPKRCFAQDDLYTLSIGGLENRDLEKFFFGDLDTLGSKAVAHFADFTYGDVSHEAFESLLPYMSAQKLRTPRGLAWLRWLIKQGGQADKNKTLLTMRQYANLFCAIWAEAVWQIADASKSPTKFIISDNPVVVYNRECFPGSPTCRGFHDPDVRCSASHTYFPLSPDKVLILTNLSWVRDPYQKPMKLRPNPEFMRNAMFKFTDIQVDRFLTEEEVLQINYVTKMRADRYIAAEKEEWLYPERHLKSIHWRKLGDGYLFMPDPRHIHGGGEILIGYDGGRSDSFSAYGHKRWQDGYEDKARNDREWEAMLRFKAEWCVIMGQEYRGIPVDRMWSSRPLIRSMDDEYFADECARDKEAFKKPGERARRRRLRQK